MILLFKKPVSLRRQLARSHMLISTSLLLVCTVGFLINDYILSTEALKTTVESTASILNHSLTSEIASNDRVEAEKTLKSLIHNPIFQSAVVVDSQDRVFATYPAGQEGALKDKNSFAFPVVAGEESIGRLFLLPKKEFIPQSWGGYALVILLVVISSLLLSRTLSLLITRGFIHHVAEILHTAYRIRETGDYSLRAPVQPSHFGSSTEIVRLAQEINRMLVEIEARNYEILKFTERLEITVDKRTTELREAQEGLVQSSRLSALGEMSANLAHEINNPLAIISAKTTQLKRLLSTGFEGNREDVMKGIEKIETTVDLIAKIIKGLKTFSRDGTEDPSESFSLNTMIDETLELCRSRFKNMNVELRLKSAPDIMIKGRPTQIGQVLLNLINNAYDAVCNTSPAWVEISLTKEDGMTPSWIKIVVRDSGPGIHPEIAKKIMQPFFTTKGVGKGTGLGLSISKGIIESHGGTLTLDNQDAHTTFMVRLPA